MSVVDELRARRGDPSDPFDQDAARRDYRSQRRHEDDSDRANVNAGHKAGVDEERKRSEKKKRPADKKRPAKSGPAKKAARARRSAKRTYRQLGSPLHSQVASFTQTFGLTLAVIALYQLLSSASQVSGALDAVRHGFEWLARPDTVVLPNHK